MMNNNKILTVSYGTFSCTLEGFEDSFDTMKAIAEYFRDLAADDRYFGAEPPQPDAEMLARIAEREVARRVEAREHEGRIMLKAHDEAIEPAPAPSAPAPTAAVAAAAAMADLAKAPAAEEPVAETQAFSAPYTDTPEPPAEVPAAEAAPFVPPYAYEEPAAAPADTVGDSAAPFADEIATEEAEAADAFLTQDAPAGEDTIDEVAAFFAGSTVEEAADPEMEESISVEAFTNYISSEAAAEAPAEEEVTAESREDDIAEEETAEDVAGDDLTATTEPEAAEPQAVEADMAEDVGETFEVEDVTPQVTASESFADKLARIRAVVSRQDDVEEAEDYYYDEPVEMTVEATAAEAHVHVVEEEDRAQVDIEEAEEIHDEAEAAYAEEPVSETETADAEEEAVTAETHIEEEAFEAEAADEEDADTIYREETAVEVEITIEDEEMSEAEAEADDTLDYPQAAVSPYEEDDAAEQRPISSFGAMDTDLDAPFTPPVFTDVDRDLVAEAAQDIEDALQMDDDTPADGGEEENAELDDLDAVLSGFDAYDAEDVSAYEDEADNLFDEADEAVDADAQDTAQEVVHGRVMKVNRADLEAALEAGDLKEYEDENLARTRALSDEDEEDLQQALAEAEAEPKAARPKSHRPARESLPAIDEDADTGVSRLMAEADHQMEEPEGRTRRSAFSHLRAAVAARFADRTMEHEELKTEEKVEAYRNDLADAVKPRRPESGDHRSERPSDQRQAPLKLVAEQRIQPEAAPAKVNTIAPRRVSATLEVTEDTPDTGFAAYAEERGAVTLPELLEAAASYLCFVEGHEEFSRPQLMTRVRQADCGEFSREDGLRSFGQLLRTGKIEKIKGGRFAASEAIGYKPDHRAAG